MRLMGATAIYFRCPKYRGLSTINRPLTDLDFMTLSKYAGHVPDVFSALGFEGNARVNTLYGLTRQIYDDPKSGRHVDVFFDKLSFCHEIDLTRRLQLETVTLPLADLLLEKLQIVKINEKDVKDVIMLLFEHGLGTSDAGLINEQYIAETLADDWGFYYTAATNLKKVRNYVGTLTGLAPDDKRLIQNKIDMLLGHVDRQDKSFKWRMRAKVGTKMKWYNEIEEVENRAVA